jgi:hypothetical protein
MTPTRKPAKTRTSEALARLARWLRSGRTRCVPRPHRLPNGFVSSARGAVHARTECHPTLVPTLCVGMHSPTLRVVFSPQNADAERPGRHSHAERGNERLASFRPQGMRHARRYSLPVASFGEARRAFLARTDCQMGSFRPQGMRYARRYSLPVASFGEARRAFLARTDCHWLRFVVGTRRVGGWGRMPRSSWGGHPRDRPPSIWGQELGSFGAMGELSKSAFTVSSARQDVEMP